MIKIKYFIKKLKLTSITCNSFTIVEKSPASIWSLINLESEFEIDRMQLQL